MTDRVLLLPWIKIDRPIVIGDVSVLPFADALEQAGHRRAQLEAFGSIYVDGYSLGIALQNGVPVPHLTPTVVFVSEDDQEAQRARDAVNVLMLSTILENSMLRSNGTTFAAIGRWLDGEHGFFVDFTPRMHGSTTNLVGAGAYLEMKPPGTGPFHHLRNRAMVEALWAAVNGPNASELRDLFDTLRTATSESPDVSMTLAESLLAKASLLLTHQPGVSDSKGPMLQRVRAILANFLPETTGDEYGFHIARVWQVVRDHRNDFWHPERRGSKPFPFSGQRLVTPFAIALRMIHALLSARLIELGCAPADSELVDDVVGVEHWIATLEPGLEAGLETMSGVALQMEHNERAQNAEASFKLQRSKAKLQRGIERHLAQYPA